MAKILWRAFPFEMDYGCTRQIIIPAAGLAYPVTQVNIFSIHKKLFVKSTNFFEDAFF